METKKGYLYCLHNEMFNFYGKNVYKLGETADIEKMLPAYLTPYFTPPTIKYSSNQLDNSQLAEKILFYELKEHRMANNREFFKCELSKIKSTIDKISDLFKKKTLENIREKYSIILYEDVTENIIEKIIATHDDQKIKSYIESFNFNKQFVETNEAFIKIEREIQKIAPDMSKYEKELLNLFSCSNLVSKSFEEIPENDNNTATFDNGWILI